MSDKADGTTLLLGHGGGGELTRRLLAQHILPAIANPLLDPLTDSAVIALGGGAEGSRLCFTTDASVVKPLFFPGGDIGRLAVCGTVNDLAMMGAKPLALSLALIIEEGFTVEALEAIMASIGAAAREAGVAIATGDTKVVERRGGDGLFIATAGVGLQLPGLRLDAALVRPGDVIVVSGSIAEHGLAVMSVREGLRLQSAVHSDVAPIAVMANGLAAALGEDLRFLRDPTRGGLADLVEGCGHSVEVEEGAIPLREATRHLAEVLGLDPLVVANEGKLVAVVAAERAAEALAVCQASPYGAQAAVIGRVIAKKPALVELCTRSGGRRWVQRPQGEELPRIC